MLEASDRPNALLNEVYRYRLAVSDQRERVNAAAGDWVRAANDKKHELVKSLVGGDPKDDRYQRQWEMLPHADLPERWRLKTEAQFLLTSAAST